jgi:hypothetical protein
MRITNAYSPTEEELVQSAAAHRLKLVAFSLELERLEPTDMLPRYNRCRVIVEKIAEFLPEIIFVTVRRQGSKLGSENFYTEPVLYHFQLGIALYYFCDYKWGCQNDFI